MQAEFRIVISDPKFCVHLTSTVMQLTVSFGCQTIAVGACHILYTQTMTIIDHDMI